MNIRVLTIATAGLLAVGITTLAADWPQWRGPQRTDVSTETGLLQKWTDKGPQLLWTFDDAGSGYSAFSIVGDRLFSMGADQTNDFVFALDAKTGKKLWSTNLAPRYINGWCDGPRGTPTFDGGQLYCITGSGQLTCLDAESGKEKWSKNLKKDFKGEQMGGWGYSESPLVDGDTVVCTPGGSGGSIVALNKESGELVWRSKGLTDAASYSSIIIGEVDGVRMYIQVTAKGVAGVSAKDGSLLWHYDRPGYRTAVIPTPIFHEGTVYASAGYGAGCDLIKLTHDGDKFKAEQVYQNKNMVNHHGGVVRVGEYLYGYSEGKGWVCQDLKTGEVVWSDRKLGKGSLTCADGQLYCYSEDKGTVVLATATPKGWQVNGQFQLPRETKLSRKRGKFWTHPVVANGKLYMRDQDLIFAFDVKDGTLGSR